MTDPGGKTPWGDIEIPAESKLPDVPIDLAAVADKLDTILKNTIGGSKAPTSLINPTLLQASGLIGTAQTQISSLTTKVNALDTRVNGLDKSNTADMEYRPWNYTIWSTSTKAEVMHTHTVAPQNYATLMIAYFNSCWYWPTLNQYWLLISGLDVRVDGEPVHTNRMQALAAGQFQTLNGVYLANIPAGKGVNMRHTIQCNPGAPSSFPANNLGFFPYIYTIQIPYSGTLPPVPHT